MSLVRDMRTTLREVLNDEFHRPNEAIAIIPIGMFIKGYIGAVAN